MGIDFKCYQLFEHLRRINIEEEKLFLFIQRKSDRLDFFQREQTRWRVVNLFV